MCTHKHPSPRNSRSHQGDYWDEPLWMCKTPRSVSHRPMSTHGDSAQDIQLSQCSVKVNKRHPWSLGVQCTKDVIHEISVTEWVLKEVDMSVPHGKAQKGEAKGSIHNTGREKEKAKLGPKEWIWVCWYEIKDGREYSRSKNWGQLWEILGCLWGWQKRRREALSQATK